MPPVTQTLLIASVAVYLLQSASGGVLEEWFALWPPGHGFAIWQLVTYGFLHGGIAHIFFNMLGLYMFGSDIERLFGSRYFLAYYFACLIAAALTQLVFTSIAGGPPFPTLGPSGGLYGLLLAFGMYFPPRMRMLILPPIQVPACSIGKPSRNSFTISAVSAPLAPSQAAVMALVAMMTGWKTVRCMSLVQPRNWHQMTTMIPPGPVSPPSSPLRNPIPMSAG